MKPLNELQAVSMGFSTDKRKRRNQHRSAARDLYATGGFFNCFSARGSTFGDISAWHRDQVRSL